MRDEPVPEKLPTESIINHPRTKLRTVGFAIRDFFQSTGWRLELCPQWRLVCLSLSCVIFVVGCRDSGESADGMQEQNKVQGKPVVYSVSVPLHYFAERLAGDSATTLIIPETAVMKVPQADVLRTMQSADLIFVNGMEQPTWLQTVSLPESKMVDTQKAVTAPLFIEDSFVHRHGPQGTSVAKEKVWCTWLDLRTASAQVERMQEYLARLIPDDESLLARGEAIRDDLKTIDQAMEKAATKLADVEMLVTSPQLAYWVRRYGLKAKFSSLPIDDGLLDKEKLDLLLADFPARVVVWADSADRRLVSELESLGIRSLVIDTGARYSETEWIERLGENVQALETLSDTVSRNDDSKGGHP